MDPLLLLLLLLTSATAALSSPSDDAQALLEFKKGVTFDPSNSLLASWSSDSQPCTSWSGVSCDAAGNVEGLDLSGLGLSGDVKLATLTSLSAIKNISLAGNNLTGRIVPGLGSLSTLQRLDLSSNLFYGPIPDRITEISGLNYLNLSGNAFTGPPPSGIENWQQLRALDLSRNTLWGDMGALISSLRYLEHVDLSCNNFTGSLAVEADNLTSLGNTIKFLNFSYNQLSGGFFSSGAVQVLGNLQVLDVTGNRLSGQLPQLDLLFGLRVFRVGGNMLSGPVPDALFGTVLQLVELDLSGNGFSGSISSIESSTLKFLNLSMNTFSGPLPSGLKTCLSVDLSNNMFTGDLTVTQSWSSTLQSIDLSSNQLSGEYPTQVAQFQNLTSIKIRNNSLTGPLPSVLGNFSQLLVIDLSLNQFTGPLLPSFFTSLTLTSLNVSWNQLTGVIPFPSSQLTESLVLPSYTHLSILDLSNNMLIGSLPSQIGNFQSLQWLSVQKNRLSGDLPVELGKLGALKYLDLSINHFKGVLPDMPLGLLFFNVSYNDLSGIIPQSLQNFPDSSFHPGNSLLLYSNGMPGAKNGKHSSHLKTSVRVAFIVGSIGVVMIILFIIMMIYVIRTQDLCGNRFKCKVISRELKLGRFGPGMFRSPKDNARPNSVSFSNDHLLKPAARSMSAQKELLAEAVESDYSNTKGTTESSTVGKLEHYSATIGEKSPPGSPLSSQFDARLSEQPVILDVYSPDRLAGELFFLENSLFFTAEELSRAPAEVLGRSSHGTSYKATLDSGQVLTVKWLRVGLVKNKKDFSKEAKKIGTIKHPNIIPWRAYYWGPREQERLIITDYVQGDSLGLYLYESTPRRYSRLSVSQRLKIAIDVAGSLSYLHIEKGLPHGSLKPSNVLLTGPDLTAHLADYGLHRLMTQSGIAEHILNMGALGYRPPELANCAKPLPTFKADVYAFGVILMELLTRRSAGDIISGQSGAVDLTDWVQMCNREGRGPDCFDRDIAGLEEAPSVMDQLLAVSLRCILPVNERPNIRTVYEDLCSITV